MKRTGLGPRRTPLSRSPMPRGGKPGRKKRSSGEFQRVYGSKARVRWIASQPCVCGCGRTPCQNAHSVTGGMGRKAGYETIVPLHPDCHRRYDQHQPPFDTDAARQAVKDAAAHYNSVWERSAA